MKTFALAMLGLMLVLLYASAGQGAYVLEDNYSGSTFFDNFNFITADDPTPDTYVNYVDRPTAQANGLISASSSSGVYIGADHTNTASGRGRTSVRVQSKKQYNSGLVIADIAHMPVGCGAWPALWLLGPNWPAGGEIDILENVGFSDRNQVTLHTTDGCTMVNQDPASFTGYWASTLNNGLAKNCYRYAPGQWENQGCGIMGYPGGYGTQFNQNQGGIYATEFGNGWPIKVWFFPRNSIPADILAGNPIPSNWGTPLAAFNMGSDCSPNHFYNMEIVINISFCGGWAIDRFGPQGCPGTCEAFVQSNPGSFSEAFWRFNSVKVYQYQF